MFRWLGQHIFECRSRGDHREHVVRLDTLRIDQHRTIIVVERFLQLLADIGRAFDVDTFNAVGFCQFHKVRIPLQIHTAFAIVEEKLLPLAHHAEVVIIQHEDLDRQLMNSCGRQFTKGHLESTVTRNRNHGLIRAGKLRPDRSRKSKSHRACTTGAEPFQ